MEKYLGNWSSKSDMCNDFGIDLGEDVHIIIASYDTPEYEGYAFVLYEQNGKLYEVNGSHCSCFGLEDQWEPEETTIQAIKHIYENGSKWSSFNSYCGDNCNELREVIGQFLQSSSGEPPLN